MVNSILRALIVGVATAAFTPTVAGAGQAPHCGNMSFARQSDDGAFQIVARATNCGTARGVASASRPSRFRGGDPQYAAEGFSCSGRSEQLGGAGKHVVRFQCTRQRSSVSFLRG